ncbi:MAG: HAD family hydrolase [Chthoniobacterales bacterium]
MLKAVIFDVDGTLVDSVDAHAKAWTEALEQAGVDCDFASVRHQIGKGGDQLLKEFLSDEEIERRGKELEEARKEIFTTNYLEGIQGFPKVRELFQRLLADKKQVVLASSAVEDELAAYKEKARTWCRTKPRRTTRRNRSRTRIFSRLRWANSTG